MMAIVLLGGLTVIASEIQPNAQGHLLFTILSTLAFVYCLFAGVTVTADCLSGEKREGTLGLLFLTDLRGYDVVLGKLAASSLKSVYALFAIVPVLSLAMLLGGVTGGEMARVVGVLLNTLFFSLAAGVFVSALSRNERKAMFAAAVLISLVALGPAGQVLVGRAIFPTTAAWLTEQEKWALSPSPLFAMWMAFAPSVTTRFFSSRELWYSLLSTHLLGWLLLGLSSFLLPRVWQDRPKSGRRFRWWERWRRWVYGDSATRAAVRARLLDRNPFLWVAGRDRVKAKSAWLFLGTMALLWIPAWLVSFDTVILAAFFLLFCTQGVFKMWLVSEVCSRWVEDRQSGAMELLLSSSLSVPDIVRGQKLALRAQFGKALAVVVMLDLLLWYLVKFHYGDSSAPGLLATIPAGMVMLAADWIALRWIAMWLALTSKSMGQALGGAWIRVLGLPWLIFLGLNWSWMLLTEFMGRSGPNITTTAWTICWLAIGLALDLVFGLQAKRNLLTEFRVLASDHFNPWARPGLMKSAVELIQGIGGVAKRRPSAIDAPTRRFLVRRHALIGSMLGAAILAAGWFGWYRWSLAKQITARLASIQRAGYPVNTDDVATWHPPIPNEENAARVVERATFSLYSTQWLPKPEQASLQSVTSAGLSLRTTDLSAEARHALSALISSNQAALTIIGDLTNFSQSRYDNVWSQAQSFGWTTPLGRVHELMQLLRLEACLRLEDGEPEKAVQSLSALLTVTWSLAQEPMLRPRGLQNAGLNAAASALERLLTQRTLSALQLQELSDRFLRLRATNGLTRALAGERYLRINYFQIPPQRLIALWMPGATKWQTSAMSLIQGLRIWTGMRDREFLSFLDATELQMAAAALSFPENLRRASQLARLAPNRSAPVLGWFGGLELDLSSILTWEAEKESRLGAVLAGLAVERYRLANEGQLPETLERLIPEYLKTVPLDPFDGKPIRYKRLTRGYVIYGIGKDEKDDGGQEYKGYAKRPSDVTFTVER